MAQPVALAACRFAADPAGLAGCGGDLSVQAHGELGGHERPPGQAVMKVELVETPGLAGHGTDRDLDAGGAEGGDTAAAYPLIGGLCCDDDAVHARGDDRIRAAR